MALINGSVGNTGTNLVEDAKTVQQLLNQSLHLLSPTPKLTEDGKVGPKTISAIKDFQLKVVRMPVPDGRVDVRGRTLAELIRNARPMRPAHVQAFIQLILPSAQKTNTDWGVPTSICIAQAALESAWGNSVVGNAYFGIKGKSPSGNTTNFGTSEVVNGKTISVAANFRAYKDLAEASDDYGRMLSSTPRFQSCFAHKQNPLKFAEGLQSAGYATDPSYSTKLKQIIMKYGLFQYD